MPKYAELGKTGIKISKIGIGTWQMDKSEKSVQAIKEGIKAGANFVDTAEFYYNEEMVGKAISGEDIVIATKVFTTHFRYDSVIKACNRSLEKLGVKTIDLYQLHFPTSFVKIEETMKAMEKLVDDGKIRYIGVSNFNVNQLKKAQSAMKKYEIVSNQVEYSPMVRYVEDELLDYCIKNNITIIAYSPLVHGDMKKIVSLPENPVEKLGKKYSSTPYQIALSWLTSRNNNVVAIPKSSNPERVRENVKSMDINLTEEEINEISAYFSKFKKTPTVKKVGWLVSLSGIF
ncbi:aldo/keto reductase [Caldiplasma sukawensis]